MLNKMGAVTVIRVFPEIAPEVAVIVLAPASTPAVAKPPAAMDTSVGDDEPQVTEPVMICVEVSV